MILFPEAVIIAAFNQNSFLLVYFGFDFGSLSGNQIGDQGATALAQQLCHLVNLKELMYGKSKLSYLVQQYYCCFEPKFVFIGLFCFW